MPVDHRLHPQTIASGAMKTPVEGFLADAGFLQFAEHIFLPIVPQHRFAKDQPKRHLVDQRFQRACRLAGAGKISVRPSPEVETGLSPVVSLDSKPQRFARKAPPVHRDLPGKTSVRVWRARETRSEERRVGKECRSRWSPDH